MNKCQVAIAELKVTMEYPMTPVTYMHCPRNCCLHLYMRLLMQTNGAQEHIDDLICV